MKLKESGLKEDAERLAPFSHQYWMSMAIREAEIALDMNEVPVGCLIVQNEAVIAKGHNLTETLKDPTAHAELMAITAACAHLESRYLTDVTLYVTLEPCAMCAGAIVLARIPTLVFGAYDAKAGACGTLYTITEDKRLNHQVQTLGGISDTACGLILKEYFSKLRQAPSPHSADPD
jgi:tRNA(adenine34) deaminase